MAENKIKVRYDSEADILYIISSEGEIEDTLEVGEDVFVEVDTQGKIIGIEIWQARKHVFKELLNYLEEVKKSYAEMVK